MVLTAIFGWLVYGRYVLNATPTWVEQVSLLLVVLITFVGAAVGIREQTHLGVSYFRELCPRWLRQAMTFLSHLVLRGVRRRDGLSPVTSLPCSSGAR